MGMGTKYFVLVAVLSGLAILSLEWLREYNLSTLAYVVIGMLNGFAMSRCAEGIRSYSATSKLDAKISNEKIRLVSTTLNTLAIAAIVAGCVAPFVTDSRFPLGDPISFIWLVAGVYVHIKARDLLNYLKDEDQFAADLAK